VDTSAEARVIASFTFIVSLLLGAWGAIDNLLTGASSLLPDSEFARLAIALMPIAATAVAFQAGNAAQAAWARALGSAAVMLGVLTSIGGVLYFLANT
jgi:C4-dicarboxylate transporter